MRDFAQPPRLEEDCKEATYPFVPSWFVTPAAGVSSLIILVFGLDIAGEVVDAGSSKVYKAGDRIMAPGVVAWSDGCSFQTHALVNEDHATMVYLRPLFLCHP